MIFQITCLMAGAHAPVILVRGFQLDALTLVPCHKFVWAGTDGLFVEVMSAGDQVCRKDGISVMAQVCKKPRSAGRLL